MADNDSVSVVITITKKDYAAAARGMMARRIALLGSILFWVSLASFAYVVYEATRTEAVSRISQVLAVLGIAIFAWYFRFGAPLLAASNFVRKNPNSLGPTTQEISMEGVSIEGPRAKATISWSAYQRVRETRQVFLLYPQSNIATIVPKRCFNSPDEIEKYRAIIRRYCSGTLELQS